MAKELRRSLGLANSLDGREKELPGVRRQPVQTADNQVFSLQAKAVLSLGWLLCLGEPSKLPEANPPASCRHLLAVPRVGLLSLFPRSSERRIYQRGGGFV